MHSRFTVAHILLQWGLAFSIIDDTYRVWDLVLSNKRGDVILEILPQLIKVIVYAFYLLWVQFSLVKVFFMFLFYKYVIQTQLCHRNVSEFSELLWYVLTCWVCFDILLMVRTIIRCLIWKTAQLKLLSFHYLTTLTYGFISFR